MTGSVSGEIDDLFGKGMGEAADVGMRSEAGEVGFAGRNACRW